MNLAVLVATATSAVAKKRCGAERTLPMGNAGPSRDFHVPARTLSFLTVLPLLLLGACAETQPPMTIAAAPSTVSGPAPTPSCNAPQGNQADKQNPSTPWQRAIDRKRAEDCEQALDPRPAPSRPEYVGNPRQEAMDRRTLDLAPLGLRGRLSQGSSFRDRLPIPESCQPHC